MALGMLRNGSQIDGGGGDVSFLILIRIQKKNGPAVMAANLAQSRDVQGYASFSGVLNDAGTYTVRGKAWSGSGPVTTVEVSLTGEGDWEAAQLEPSQDPSQWQDWFYTWQAPTTGRHTLRARATDAAGNVQPDVPPWNRLGYGNNAIEVPYVDVR